MVSIKRSIQISSDGIKYHVTMDYSVSYNDLCSQTYAVGLAMGLLPLKDTSDLTDPELCMHEGE